MDPQIKKVLKAIKVKPNDTNKNTKLKRLKKLIRQEKENMQESNYKKSTKQTTRNNLLSASNVRPKPSKKLKILSKDDTNDNDNLTIDEKKAIELYAATRKGKQRSASTSGEDSDDSSSDGAKLLEKEPKLFDKHAVNVEENEEEEGDDR